MKMNFKTVGFLASIPLFLFASTSVSEPKTLYYFGHIESKHLSSNHIFPIQEITLKKVMDSKNSRIVEIACAPIGPSSPAQYTVSPIYMAVKNNSLRIADKPDYTSNSITGTGSVFGEDWNWENLTFDMKTTFGEQISWVKDVNFVAGPHLYGTKYIFINEGTQGSPKRKADAELIMNLKMTEISIEVFKAHNSTLGCDNSLFEILN